MNISSCGALDYLGKVQGNGPEDLNRSLSWA